MHISSFNHSQAAAGRSAGGVGAHQWQVHLRRSSDTASQPTGDRADISRQGFAALMQLSGGQPPMPNDSQAAQLGESLKTQNAEAFSKLDADANGTLSADEFTAAMEELVPPPFLGTGQNSRSGMPPITDDLANQIGSLIQKQDAGLFKKLDGDHNGSLDAGEMESGMSSGILKPPGGGAMGGMGSLFGNSGDAQLHTNILLDLLRSQTDDEKT